MESRNIRLSDGLNIVKGEKCGIVCDELGVTAACDLQEGEVIAIIPKDACLTLRTTGAANLLNDAQLSGGLGLVVALMYERSRGEASPWFPYLNLLPLCHKALPIVWESDEIHNFLLGTELHSVILEDRKLIEEDWRECIWPLTQEYPTEFPEEHFSLEHYFSAKTLVSSRSFEVDDYHGYGMVPVADLFNHKTNNEDVHVMDEPNLCIIDESVSTSDRHPVEEESNYLGCSFIDNLTNAQHHSCSTIKERNDQCRNEVLEIVLVRDVPMGSEIFNTYGELSNASLLHRHGFTEPDNPFDIVNIDYVLVMQYCTSFFSKCHVRNRIRFWRKYGCAPLTSQASEYFEIEASGKPQPELLFLLYIMHLPEKDVLAAEVALHELDTAVKADCAMNWEMKAWKTFFDFPANHLKRARCNRYTWSKSEGEIDSCIMFFFTSNVCESLIWLSEKRDQAYGQATLEEDLKLLEDARQRDNEKLFHALYLRVSERSILRRLCHHSFEELKKNRSQKRDDCLLHQKDAYTRKNMPREY
ncbi:hypothetical protein KP509_15G074600 [Ceratopteris richardii]|nr:hypothetical protein KP509_15G074600 [Ceratopteris richardii]